MKKILTMLLAVAMVLSMLPVTTFAAGSECPVADEAHDGFYGHSVAHCEYHDVEYTEISKVEPECGVDGYTLYQCECGEYFADGIVKSEPHDGVLTAERVDPTCVKPGKAAMFTCQKCDAVYPDPDEDEDDANGVIPATGDHDYKTNGIADCTAAERKCTVCGKADPQWSASEKHEFVYNDPDYYEVKKVPTEDEKGEIWFYCTHDGCEQYKPVQVNKLPHTHEMEEVDEETVDTDGIANNCEYKVIAAHYKCTKCGNLYTDDQGLNATTLEDLTEEYEHDWNTDPTIIPPTCLEWGFSYYGCPTCGAKKDFKEIKPLGHTWFECKVHGRNWNNNCEECADAKLSKDYNKTEATCMVDGEHTWKCGRCDIDRDDPIVHKGHAITSVTVPATCGKPYTYTFTYCTNENCTDAAGNPYGYVDEVVVEFNGAPLTLDVTVEVREDGNVYDLDSNHEFKVITVEVEDSDDEPVHFYTAEDEVQAPDCRNPGKAFWFCVGCNDHHVEDLKALGHDYSNLANDIAATCTTDAKKVCDRPGCCYGPNNGAFQFTVAGTKGHKWETEIDHVTLPTCTGDKGYDWYACKNCNEFDKRNEQSFVINKTYMGRDDLELTAKEEFELEHPNFNGTYHEYRAGNCTEYGYWKAHCDTCDWTYLVLIDGTGAGHSFTNYVSNNDATCTEDGTETAICDRPNCGESDTRTDEGSALGHDFEGNYVSNNDATCLVDGTETAVCGRDDCDETHTRKDENSKLNHNFENNMTEEVDDCRTPGFKHFYCSNGCCNLQTGKGEYVDFYVDEVEHVEDDPVIDEADCENDGSKKIFCEICDDLLSEETLPATGHKNAAGKPIVGICTDKETDRICVNENCPAPVDQNGKHFIEAKHAPVQETVAPGCENFGYVLDTCDNEGCDELDHIDQILDPIGHKAPWLVEVYDEVHDQWVYDYQTIMADDMTAINENVIDDYLGYEEFDEDAGESYTAPTYEALGSVTFKCAACADLLTRDVVRTGVDFTMDIDNAVVSGAFESEDRIEFNDGDIIAVTVTMNAYKTNIRAFQFYVDYDATSMNYLGYKFHAGEVFNKNAASNLTEDYVEKDMADDDHDGIFNENIIFVKDAMGEVTVAAYIDKEDSKAIELTGSVEVITLYFQLESELTVEFRDVPFTENNMYGYVDLFNAVVSDDEGEQIFETEGDYIEFDMDTILDINEDGRCDILDVVACYELSTAREYYAAADANKDGRVDFVDMGIIYERAQKVITDKDVIDSSIWTVPVA